MRCYCCDVVLSDFEATRRSALTGGFLDVCNGCFKHIADDVCAIERADLRHESDEDYENEDGYEE